MADTISPAMIKKTQDILGKHVTQPSLTTKLLGKPPFKFLHDVINAVITNTGFLDGLYTDAELSKENIKDKDAKILFLQKCIDATIMATGEDLSVRPNKVVSGHEADKTNELLQAIARAVEQKTESSDAVQKVLAGEKPAKSKGSKDKPGKSDKAKTRSKDDKSRGRSKPGDATKDDKKRPGRERRTSKEEKEKGASRKSKDDKAKRPSRAGKENAPPAVAAAPAAAAAVAGATAADTVAAAAEEEPVDSAAVSEDILEDPADVAPPPLPPAAAAAPEPVPTELPGFAEGESLLDDTGGTVVGEATDSVDAAAPFGEAAAAGDDGVSGTIIDDDIEVLPNPEEDLAPPDDPGIGSAGPGSLVGEGLGEGAPPPASPPPAPEIDAAILKAMDPDGDLNNPELPEHSDSGVGSIDSPPKSASPSADPEPPPPAPFQPEEDKEVGGEEGDLPAAAPIPAAPSGRGPMKAVHPGGGEGMPTAAARGRGGSAMPSRPPSSQGYASRPMTSRSQRPRTARPPSARPAAPRIRERKEAPEDEVRPSTSKATPPLTALIMEGGRGSLAMDRDDPDLDGADDDFLVADRPAPRTADDDPLNLGDALAAPMGDDDPSVEGGGLLMDQILDVKKNLEDGRQAAFSPETPGHRRVNLAADSLNDASRRKDREAIQQDVSKLAASIQTLTRAVNPLAKMLDYLQEDLDSMQKELEKWRTENKTLRQTLRNEQGNMTACIEPLTVQLQELNTAILEQQDRISIAKCSTLKNATRIHTLLSAVSLGAD